MRYKIHSNVPICGPTVLSVSASHDLFLLRWPPSAVLSSFSVKYSSVGTRPQQSAPALLCICSVCVGADHRSSLFLDSDKSQLLLKLYTFDFFFLIFFPEANQTSFCFSDSPHGLRGFFCLVNSHHLSIVQSSGYSSCPSQTHLFLRTLTILPTSAQLPDCRTGFQALMDQFNNLFHTFTFYDHNSCHYLPFA